MDEASKLKLWDEYSKTTSPSKKSEIREKLILAYAPLVKLVAGRLYIYLGYNVEFDDLVGYGIFGLIDAIDKFDPTKAVKFETYASLRIRGEILDKIRSMDWIPRSIRQKQKKIEAAMAEIEHETGRSATDEEIAAKLGISEDDLLDWQGEAKVSNIMSLDEFTESGCDVRMDARRNSHFEQPETAAEKDDLKKQIAAAIDELTEKERMVVTLYYYEEMTLREISEVMEVTESRVSQLHTKALRKLQEKLGDYASMLFS
ncbi:MAG: FliA/WhiG family RNA polymerase sigma factor [Lachnospiraceae bacterium]|nr:FliA/WhiG family RNA polymerase sigma factor [Lachnospiraceae bacterium]